MLNQAANNSENNSANRNVTLVLFHNDLRLADNATLLKASEISIDGNPISSTTRFKNQLILGIPRLEILDEDKIGDLDREVANQYFEMHGLEKP